MSNLDLIEAEVNKTITASLGTPVKVIVDSLESLISDAMGADKVKAQRSIIALKTCILASTNVRDGAVLTGADRIVASFEPFSISGTRSQKDTMNFSAVRMAGHILNAVSSSTLAAKLNSKAGNMITGIGFSEGKAGKINQETFMGLTEADKKSFKDFKDELDVNQKAKIDSIYGSIGA